MENNIRAWCPPPGGGGDCVTTLANMSHLSEWVPVQSCSQPYQLTTHIAWLPEVLVNLPIWLYLFGVALGLGRRKACLLSIVTGIAPAEAVLGAIIINQFVHTAYHALWILPPWWMDSLSCLCIGLLHFATCALLQPIIASSVKRRRYLLRCLVLVLFVQAAAFGVTMMYSVMPSSHLVAYAPLILTWLSVPCLGGRSARKKLRCLLAVLSASALLQIATTMLQTQCDLLMAISVGSWHVLPDIAAQVSMALQLCLARKAELLSLEKSEDSYCPRRITIALDGGGRHSVTTPNEAHLDWASAVSWPLSPSRSRPPSESNYARSPDLPEPCSPKAGPDDIDVGDATIGAVVGTSQTMSMPERYSDSAAATPRNCEMFTVDLRCD